MPRAPYPVLLSGSADASPDMDAEPRPMVVIGLTLAPRGQRLVHLKHGSLTIADELVVTVPSLIYRPFNAK